MGKLLRREGADLILSSTFYCVVVQAVRLFGAETWFLVSLMQKILKGVHTGFLIMMAGKRVRQQRDGSWEREGADSVL